MTREVAPLVLAFVTAVSVTAEAQDSLGARADFPEVSFRQVWSEGLAGRHYRMRGIVIAVFGMVRCGPCPVGASCQPCGPPAQLHLAPGNTPQQRDSAVRVLIGSSQESALRRLRVGRSYELTVSVGDSRFFLLRSGPRRFQVERAPYGVYLDGYRPLQARRSPKPR